MAHLKESSFSNPLTIADLESEAGPRTTSTPKPKFYLDLTEDDAQELTVEEIPPTSLNPPKRESDRQSISAPRSSISLRTPAGDNVEATLRSTLRQDAISRSLSRDRIARPSANTANAAFPAPRGHTPIAATSETGEINADLTASGALQQSTGGRLSSKLQLGDMLSKASASVEGMHNAEARTATNAVTAGEPSGASITQNSPTPLLVEYTMGKKDTTPPQRYNAAELESTGEGSKGSAFGNRAEAERGQTNTRRVDSDATRHPMHGHHDGRSSSTSKKLSSLEKGSQSRRRVKRRPRAAKSAGRPRAIETTPQSPTRNHDDSSSSIPLSTNLPNVERDLIASPTLGRHRSSRPVTEHPGEDPAGPRNASESRQGALRATSKPSSPTGAVPIDMGAQTSSLNPLGTSLEESSTTAPIIASHGDAAVSDAYDGHVVPDIGPSLERHDNAYVHGPANELMADALNDLETARRKVEACLQRHLEDRFEDHAYLVKKNVMWRQRTCYERDIRLRTNASDSQSASSPQQKFEQSQSPFGHMQDIQSMSGETHASTIKEMTQEMLTKTTSKGPTLKSTCGVPVSTHVLEELQIPSFKEYVRLKINILTDNESKILTLPYLGEDEPEDRQDVLRKELPTRYEILHDKNALLDLRHEQCRFYYKTTEAFLTDIGVSWETMIYWLLSSAAELQLSNRTSDKFTDFEDVVMRRAPYDTEVFTRDEQRLGGTKATLFEPGSPHWEALLTRLQKPSVEHLRLVALAGAAFVLQCNFSPWYMIKQSETMQDHVHAKLKRAEEAPDVTFRSMLCRICHEHDCVFHGAIRENPRSDSETDDSEEDDSEEDDSEKDDSESDGPCVKIAHYDSENSDVEKTINYKFPVNSGRSDDDEWSESGLKKHRLPPAGQFKAGWWKNTAKYKWEDRKPFFPCNHPGSCVDAKCRCFRENINCEKTCRCPQSCNRRFPGCTCTQGKRTCVANTCLCKSFERECDADLCGTCGADDVLDPIRRHDEEYIQTRCKNVALQRSVPKKTLLGRSEVHGFGLYAGEDICKDELIGEYTGELISSSESRRREILYHYDKNMYLFRVNKEQEVDATYMGNKLRFINNADDKFTNCSGRVSLCNTVFRVALIASRNIKAGTELFFNYNYPKYLTKNFKQPQAKVVAIKQLVNGTSKAGKNRASSHASSNNDDRRSAVTNPAVIAATAKARAAKKAIREARLAEQGIAAVPPKNASRTSRPARKSAGSSGFQLVPRDASARGRSRQARGSASRTESAASAPVTESIGAGSVRRRRSANTPVVEETDNEHAGYGVHSDSEGSGHESQAETGDQDATSRSSSRLRRIPTRFAEVMAVKEVKKKSRLRSLVGTKRKRPVVLNSDDEV